MAIRQTHTYAVMKISKKAFDEIAQKLKDAGYAHSFINSNEIDMHGIAIKPVTPEDEEYE